MVSQKLIKSKLLTNTNEHLPNSIDILNKQLDLLINKKIISVLCTCIFYIAEYNSDFI